MDTSFFSMQRGDEFHALSVNLRTISGILNLCVSTWTGCEECARADAPLDTWIKVSYVYHPSSSPRHKLSVEYTLSSTATFQQPLLCSEQLCGANQQVATLCNATHNVTCKACQANSWSYAGRTELEPCLCNACYELQGWMCVACPVGKARQANHNNSIVCKTCSAGTFTSVSATVSCGVCSAMCDKACDEKIYDFSQVEIGQPWKDYAAAIGFPIGTMFSWALNGGGWMGQWNNAASIVGILPIAYNTVEVAFYAGYHGEVWLQIDGVTKAIAKTLCNLGDAGSLVDNCRSETVIYKQKYSAGQVLKLIESGIGGIGSDLKITLQQACDTYVRNECNASRDVICQECETCLPGFFTNNTCGANYSNDRLDTQCVPCPAGSYCPTGSGPPIQCPDNGKSAQRTSRQPAYT
jgi:hypothetical protein